MATGFLTFNRDATRGLPALGVQGMELSQAARQVLEEDLRRDYTTLILSNGRVYSCERRVDGLPVPARFRVQVREGTDPRCPEVRLEPLFEPPSTVSRPPRPEYSPNWQAGFRHDVRKSFAPHVLSQLNTPDHVALDFVLHELEQLGEQHQEVLLPLLVAGYIALGERMSVDHDQERLGLYVLAARAVDTLFQSLFPEPQKRAQPGQAPFAIKLRATVRFLARLLLTGPEI
jgi:hypothetical protein